MNSTVAYTASSNREVGEMGREIHGEIILHSPVDFPIHEVLKRSVRLYFIYDSGGYSSLPNYLSISP